MAQKQGKGKKAWTPSRKTRNESNYRKQQARKALRQQQNNERAAANRALAPDALTPWQAARALRAERRVHLQGKAA